MDIIYHYHFIYDGIIKLFYLRFLWVINIETLGVFVGSRDSSKRSLPSNDLASFMHASQVKDSL